MNEASAKQAPKHCRFCDDPLPEGREDYLCAECRRIKIVMKRANRPPIGRQSASEELKKELDA